MEPITLGVIAIGLLQKLLESAADKGAEKAIEEGGEAVGGLVKWVRHRFGGTEELARFEENFDSRRAAAPLAAMIDAEIDADPTARGELEAALAAVEKARPQAYQRAQGTGNILISSSQGVTIHQHVGSAAATGGQADWQVRLFKGQCYVLRNSGDDIAYRVDLDTHDLIRPAGDVLNGSIDMGPGDEETFLAMRALRTKSLHLTVTWFASADGGERLSRRLVLPPGA